MFYTGPVVNAEMLVLMLEKHGITATQAFADPAAPDDGNLGHPAQVFARKRITTKPTSSSTPSAWTSFAPGRFRAL